PMKIDAFTEPGAAKNTLANGDNANLLIALDGASAGPNADGFLVGATGAGSAIEGLDVFDFSRNQIELQGGGVLLAGDAVGFDTTGRPPNGQRGVRSSTSSRSTTGGTAPAARNVWSGNVGPGLEIGGSIATPATGNLVEGNFIGTDPTGQAADGNGRF